MGIYDRPYLQEEEYGGGGGGWAPGRSVVILLIVANVVVFFAGALFETPLTKVLGLWSDLFTHPWQAWQLLTYGFAHDGPGHLLFNMIGLFVFGRELESMYGRGEFLRFYLVAIVLAGLAWVGMHNLTESSIVPLVGASGGVMAVTLLWILHFPKRLIYIWGVLPVKAWLLGTFYIGSDLLGQLMPQAEGDGPRVANIAHLAGVAFAFVYYRQKLNLGRLLPRRLADLKPRALRPKLRLHDPDKAAQDLSQQVDAILEKISREGEASLTRKERRTLEEASRQYQRRKQL